MSAQRAWRSVSVAERAAICSRFCDAFEAKRDAIALELTWQMGRPIRYAPNEVSGTLERARYMIDDRAAGARRYRRRAEGRLHAFRAARAARRRVHRGGLELSVSHRREQRRPGDHGRQRRGAEALGADAALRGTVRGVLRRPRVCRRACSRFCTCRTRTPSASSQDPRVGVRGVHGLGGGRARDAARRRRSASSAQASSSAAATRRTCGTMRIWRTPWRISSMARSSTAGSRAAASSAFTCMSACTTTSSPARSS